MAVYRHGELIDTGAGAAALGNPARCVAWLANKLGSFGDGLKAGDIVLPGAVHKMVPVNPATCSVRTSPTSGAVTVRFSGTDRSDRGTMTPPQQIAQTLLAAERDRTETPQFGDRFPDLDVATAYRAQQAFVQAKIDAGDRLVGYKLGLTSRNKQLAMGVEAPLYGRVTSEHAVAHPASRCASTGSSIRGWSRRSRSCWPATSPAPATVTSVLAATEVVFGAVDVLDSRYAGFKFTLHRRGRRQRQRRCVLPGSDRPATRRHRSAAAGLRRPGGR